jgi:uncharacterized protein (TIGR02246 family)
MFKPLLFAIIAVVFAVPTFASDSSTDAVLALHRQVREAHLTGDANLLASTFADHVVEVRRARILRPSREDVRKRFQEYFAATKYSVWDDIVAPEVRISPDGRMAWMAVHIRAVARQNQEVLDFESAWVATYEKSEGRWRMTSVSSSIEDAPKPQ